MRQDEIICQNLQQVIVQDSTPELNAAEREHLAACDTCTDLLLIGLLQKRPDVEIPADFAARVRSRQDDVPNQSKGNRTTPVYGFTTAIAALIALTLAWSAFAYADPSWTIRSGFPLALEYIATAEIAVIALWLGIRRPTG